MPLIMLSSPHAHGGDSIRMMMFTAVSYKHIRAHETKANHV